jgi:hypothetical protein
MSSNVDADREWEAAENLGWVPVGICLMKDKMLTAHWEEVEENNSGDLLIYNRTAQAVRLLVRS